MTSNTGATRSPPGIGWNDKDAVMREVEMNGLRLQHVPQIYQSDRDVVLAAVRNNGMALQFADIFLKASERVVKEAVKQDGDALQLAADNCKDNKSIVMTALQTVPFRPSIIACMSKRLKTIDNDIVIRTAISKSGGWALRYATEEQKLNRDIVLSAIEHDARPIRFAHPTLLDDKEFLMEAIGINPGVYSSLPASYHRQWKDDEDIISAAFQNSNVNTAEMQTFLAKFEKYFPSGKFPHSLVSNKQILFEAVSKRGGISQHTYKELQDDSEIVTAAVLSDPSAIEYASGRLKNDKDIAIMVVTQVGKCIVHLSPQLRNDRDVVMTAIANDGFVLQHVSQEMQDDYNVVMVAVNQYGRSLRYASERLQSNYDVVLSAVTKNGCALEYASKELQDNTDIVTTAVQQDGNALQYASNSLKANKDIVLLAVSKSTDSLKYALDTLNQDEDCWIVGKLLQKGYDDEDDQVALSYKQDAMVALSTRFSLAEQSNSSVTNFTVLLNQSPYFSGRNWDMTSKTNRSNFQFVIYSPNAFSKQSCDPNWTDIQWPCHGTSETCKIQDSNRKIGKPTNDSCWRYSYRYHLEQAKRTCGFMIQVVDYDTQLGKHVLGHGQQLEYIMAREVGTKIFRVCQPVGCYCYPTDFTKHHIDQLASYIDDWYNNNKDNNTSKVDHSGSGGKNFKNQNENNNDDTMIGIELQFWYQGDFTGNCHTLTRTLNDLSSGLDIQCLRPIKWKKFASYVYG